MVALVPMPLSALFLMKSLRGSGASLAQVFKIDKAQQIMFSHYVTMMKQKNLFWLSCKVILLGIIFVRDQLVKQYLT